ncbi:DNA internalization-related competence protein ComEC/Rec2 [Vibrio profundum]|uniref:DNA internalization-related competence protein ComEC/Rec2 n=1 Tax=Vibrio profundum TaxID=2910247 RepID=UPI003D0F4DD0
MTLLSTYWALISFIITILSAPYWPMMPHWRWILPTLVLVSLSVKYRGLNWLIGCSVALLVIFFHANTLLEQSRSVFESGRNVTITARVDSFFKKINYGYEGTISILALNDTPLPYLKQGKVRLVSPVPLLPNQTTSVQVRLNHVSGWLNEAGFDKERYYLSQGWVAKAVAQAAPQKIESGFSVRNWLYQRSNAAISALTHAGLIKALLFGLRNDISASLWQQLRASGLSHLVAISGLHVGIAFAIGYVVGALVLRVSSRLIWFPLVFGVFSAVFYAGLAGFTISTQRALVMCVFNVFLLIMRVRVGPFVRWLMTLAVVLMIYPFSPLSSGFWLSFIAVAILFYLLGQSQERSLFGKLVKFQLAFTFLMMPISLLFFQGVSISSIIFNIIFVPWVSIVVVPSLFIALFLTVIVGGSSTWLWLGVDKLLSPISYAISFSENTWLAVPDKAFGFFLCLALWPVLAPLLTRSAMLLVMATIFSTVGLSPWFNKQPVWRLDVLDVGHGLAVLLQQAGEVVIYDTGPAWLGGSVAKSLIEPILRKRGVEKVEGLIVSHLDSDHAGGKEYIHQVFHPNWVRSSSRESNELPCVRGQHWRWNYLEFRVLWPPNSVSRAYNPHSCVIRIHDTLSKRNVLLTGDIEAAQEWMITRQNSDLKADILIVPHHGSRSSSSANFINKVRPNLALASLKWMGRWNLPDAEVTQRYQDAGAAWLDTANSGQISIEFYVKKYQLSLLRDGLNHTWYRQMLRKRVE